MPKTLEQRFEELKAKEFEIFYIKEFDDRLHKQEIVAEMPDIENFKESDYNLNERLSSYYKQAVLSKEQEFHLFRKMSFYNYKAKKILDNCKVPRKFILDVVDDLFKKSKKIFDLIILSNTRLAMSIVKKSGYDKFKNASFDETLSDAVIALFKAISKFDFRKGYKFSTYSSYVLYDKINKSRKEEMKQEDFVTGSEVFLENFLDYRLKEEDFLAKEELTVVLNKLNLMDIRDKEIILKYYQRNYTLQELAKEMNVTKERIRQLKDRSMKKLKQELHVPC